MKQQESFLDFDTFRARYPQAKVYVFDVDHTLTSRSTAIRLALNGLRRGYVRLRTVLTFPYHYMNYRRGAYANTDIPDFFKDLKGFSKDFLFLWGHEVFHQTIRNDLFHHAEQFVLKCHEAGIPVILSSSTFDFLIEPLARFLKIDTYFATNVEFVDGVCTGMMSGKANFASGKIAHVEAEIARRGISMDEVAFFSDSINDLPLLEEVGVPVATHADKRLKKACLEKNWELWSFEKSAWKRSLRG